MEDKKLLTKVGFDSLNDELHDLKVNRRKEIAQKIKEAREQGDLSENAEYDAAKDEQRDIEARIEELEELLKNVEVITDANHDENKVGVGSTVKVYDVEYDEEIEYLIVGSTEANSRENKISNESPLGKGLIGSEVGDTVDVEAPAGVMQFKILEIAHNG